MAYINSTQAGSSESVKIYYEEYGKGQPVIFVHGWPSSHEMWEYQLLEIAAEGYRCIAYDRRGFGKSDKPYDGYDYDTLTADLKALIDELELKDVILVGFSMGGGEVVRYCSRYGTDKLSKIILVSAVTPYFLKTKDNPQGVEKEMFDGIIQKIKEDRPAFLEDFGKMFFGVNMIKHPVSQQCLNWAYFLTLPASPKATVDCVRSFSETDFRNEMLDIRIPTLIIHGDSDKIVPIEPTGMESAKLINGSVFKIYEGAPHGLFITEKQKLNQDILEFIK